MFYSFEKLIKSVSPKKKRLTLSIALIFQSKKVIQKQITETFMKSNVSFNYDFIELH